MSRVVGSTTVTVCFQQQFRTAVDSTLVQYHSHSHSTLSCHVTPYLVL